MKKVNNISLVMIIGLLVLVMTSCGGGSSQEDISTRADKDGFNSDTNQVIEIGGYSFEIPDYYIVNEELSTEKNTDYRINDGEAVVRFAMDSESVKSKAEFDASYEEWLDGVVSGVADKGNRVGNYYTCELNGASAGGKTEVFYNEDNSTVIVALLLQYDNSSADYLPDFEKVLSSAKKVEATASDNSDNDDSGESSDSDISPEFKKTMDDYEAWFDHYCEVMKKYQDNPSDMALLSEMTELLSEETEMLKQMEDMDQSEMNSAELAYYIDVTARIQKKLLEVANY